MHDSVGKRMDPKLRKEFGGSFGTTPEHDLMTQGFYEDDGIESKLGTKLVLRTSFSKNDVGMWKVDATIIPKQ